MAIRTVRGHGYRFVLLVTESMTSRLGADAMAPHGGVHALQGDVFDAPFVGRSGVLSAFDDALSTLNAGPCRCLRLTGEPGIGKTRTLHELAARARGAGARAWFARCSRVMARHRSGRSSSSSARPWPSLAPSRCSA